MNPKYRTKPYELFEPVKVFIATVLVAIVWLLPIAIPQVEDDPDKNPKPISPFILPKVDAGWTCLDNPNCVALVCAEKIPGGGCVRYEEKCICNGGGGGGPSYSPPTISHSFNCSAPGWGDWCIGTLSIDLTASDPQGQSVIISGDTNGNNFTCPSGDTTCSIPLSEGVGNINYKVDASTGLSDSDSAPYYLDVTTPQIDGSISGTSGTNGWFTTQTLVTASASDFNSGVFSLEMNVDNAGYIPYADTTFSDGVHAIQFHAYDNAGNLTETAIQTIMVDTVSPSLSLQVDGIRGQNDFFTTSVTVTPNASDATSGINKIEASMDNGIWTVINSPLFFADGNHSYQIRVTDNAGNVTETPVQTLFIDTSPAVIAMLDDSLILGDGLIYSIEDSQSGLTELRVVIKDNDGKYKSVIWVENLDGANKYKGSVRWDGIFADGTYPTSGIYFIALKVINGAGMETIRTATIEVPVVKTAEQENLPVLVVPPSAPEETTTTPQVVQPSTPQIFGSTSNPFTGNSIQSSFSASSKTTPIQSTTTSNVLWGGAAAALLGATLAEWQRKRAEEEAARLAAMRNNGGGGDEEGDDVADKKRMKVLARVNPAYARALAQEQNLRAEIAKVTAQELKGTNISVAQAQARQQALWDANGQAIYAANQEAQAASQKALEDFRAGERNAVAIADDYEARQALIAKNDDKAPLDMDKVNALVQQSVDAKRWAGVASVAQAKQESEKKNIASTNQGKLPTVTKLLASGGIEEIVIIILAVVVLAGLYFDGNRRHRVEGVCLPGSSLTNCFNDKGRIEFSENQHISNQGFQDFLSAVKTDIDSQDRSPYSLLRSDYDTPFFDGNPRIKLPWQEAEPDRNVCIETHSCSPQSAVNYVAQGMYSAASGQSLEDAIELTHNWNLQYFHRATPEEIYWLTFGYNYYNDNK